MATKNLYYIIIDYIHEIHYRKNVETIQGMVGNLLSDLQIEIKQCQAALKSQKGNMIYFDRENSLPIKSIQTTLN